MPFRDAGYSNADFEITIQDVVYGVWRAKEKSLIDLHSFNLESYEKYEHVEFGDFNVLTPDFIAFASPQEDHTKGHVATKSSHLNQPFRSVLNFFANNDVQLVVRLNSHLYNKKHFEDIGIQHLDLIFEDGTCPDLSIVKNFVGAAETIIKRGGKIAVHCKAGLGRTGCLIGAHLIYTYGFTANECIGFLRFVRPGMVVGPQQHWLYLHQNDFREWKYTTRISLKPSEAIGGLYPLINLEEYRLQKKKLKDDKKVAQNNIEGDLRDLTMTPPPNSHGALSTRNSSQPSTVNSGSNAFKSLGVPQTSPGQPRKGQNGSNTIEDINNNNNLISHASRKAIIESNNSDDESMQDTNSISNNYSRSPRRRNDILSASSSRMEDNENNATNSINNAADDTILRQLLPKNRRVTSGKRTTSAAGGIRKISASTKK